MIFSSKQDEGAGFRCVQLNLRGLALAFGVLMTGMAFAAPVEVYRGTLGRAEVVMELGMPQPDGTREGRYFYRRHGVDIPLRGKLDQLAEAQPLTSELLSEMEVETGPLFEDAEQRQIVWHARLQGTTLTGKWMDGIRGKKLLFSLKRVARYDPENVAPQGVEAVTQAITGTGSGVSVSIAISMRNTPYDFLRVSLPMEQGKEVVAAGNLAWRPVRDARTKLWYPRLSRHPDAGMLARANALLEQRHWAINLAALDCKGMLYQAMSPAMGTLGNYDEERVTVTYLSFALMSVVESGSTSCGGAHPNNHYDPFTLDLLRGGYMDFSRILKGVSRGEYGGWKYSEQFENFVDEAKYKRGAKEDAESGCGWYSGYMYPMFEAPGRLSFVISGIGHAMGACLGDGVSLTFSQLKPLLKPEARRYLKP